jgi:hypothetical protein
MISNMQAMIDGMSAQFQRDRAATQMTLGKLITALEAMPPDTEVDGLKAPHSYRGYYCDLAFHPPSGRLPVSEMLTMCRSAMGKVFEGYKGGDFVMGELTPLWIAEYGECGERIMSLTQDGHFEIAEEEDPYAT